MVNMGKGEGNESLSVPECVKKKASDTTSENIPGSNPITISY